MVMIMLFESHISFDFKGRLRTFLDGLQLRAALKPDYPTRLYALGGVQPGKLALAQSLGFEGVVLHGALWQAADPLQFFNLFGQWWHEHSAHSLFNRRWLAAFAREQVQDFCFAGAGGSNYAQSN